MESTERNASRVGWKTKLFGSLAEFKNGLNYSKENIGKGLKIIGVSDFQRHSSIKYDALAEVSGFDKIDDSYLLRENDLLFVRSNGNKKLIGRVLHIKNIDQERITFSGFTIRARIKSDEILPAYAALLFGTPELKARLFAEGGGTNIANLNQDMLSMMVMQLPPVDKQADVVSISQTWADAIALQTRKIQQLRQRKKEIALMLFSQKIKLPGFFDKWELVPLERLFQRVTRSNHQRAVKVMSITAKRGFESQDEKFSRVIAGENIAKYISLQKNEFAYNKGNSGLHPYGVIYKLDEDEAAVPNVYLCFKGNGETDAEFYQHYFLSGAINSQLSRVINSGVRNDGLLNLSAEEFFNVSVHRIPLAEQRAIAELLNTADAEIRLHERKLDALREQKSGLLQKLLTGEILLS